MLINDSTHAIMKLSPALFNMARWVWKVWDAQMSISISNSLPTNGANSIDLITCVLERS